MKTARGKRGVVRIASAILTLLALNRIVVEDYEALANDAHFMRATPEVVAQLAEETWGVAGELRREAVVLLREVSSLGEAGGETSFCACLPSKHPNAYIVQGQVDGGYLHDDGEQAR
jgi:hypothetical protein